MGRRWRIAEDDEVWLTDEIRGLLKEIRGAHAAKKRTTIIKLAFAKANQQTLQTIFDQEDTCNQRIWYQKWQHIPVVKAAFEACYRRALEFADAETAALEAFYRRERRRSVAKHAAAAPGELAEVMGDGDQRGADRISAAEALMRLAEPDMDTTRVGVSVGVTVGDEDIDAAIERELARLAEAVEDNVAAAAAGEAGGAGGAEAADLGGAGGGQADAGGGG